MSNTAAVTGFEPIIEASGRLLRVDRDPVPGPAGARASTRLRLTFDVGALELHLDPQAGGLAASPPGEGCAVPANEEEPWWPLLGNPLCRVSERGPGELLLQFRPDDDSPRILVAKGEAGGVAVRALV